jgi:hypothetical protein
MNLFARPMLLPLLIATLTAAGCGGDGHHDDDVTLSGTAATGVALDGTVDVVDADGNMSSTAIGAGGVFSITVADNPPFMLSATSGDGETVLYSWAAGSGMVNVNPLTSVALVNAAGMDLGELFTSWADDHGEVNQEEIDDAIAVVNANLQTYYEDHDVDFTTYDFFGEEFGADGTGFDGVLDDVQVSVDGTAVVLTESGTATAIPFDLNIDITHINIGGGTSDGGDGGGGSTGTIPPDSVWQLTVTENLSGQSQTVDETFTGAELPTSESDFSDFAEGDLSGDFSFGGISVSFDLSDVSLTSDISGAVGDTISGHMEGTISVSGGGQDVSNQPIDVDYQWERIS